MIATGTLAAWTATWRAGGPRAWTALGAELLAATALLLRPWAAALLIDAALTGAAWSRLAAAAALLAAGWWLRALLGSWRESALDSAALLAAGWWRGRLAAAVLAGAAPAERCADAERLAGGAHRLLLESWSAVLRMLGGSLGLALIHPDLLVALLPAALAALFGMAVGRRLAMPAAMRAAEAEADLRGRWRERAAGAGRWLPAAADAWLAGDLVQRAERAGSAARGLAIAGGWWQPAAAAAIATGVALVLVPGARHVAAGAISAGQLAAGIFLVLLALGPLLELAAAADRWLALAAAARRLGVPAALRACPPVSSELRWSAMRIDLPDGSGLALPAGSVEPGGRLLLHGPSGAGKSTLLGILAGERAMPAGCAAPAPGPGGTVLLSQGGRLPPWTVGELLAGVEPDTRRVAGVAEDLGLAALLPAADARCAGLPDASAQAVALLAAALARPRVLLVDEAVSALPAESAELALGRIAAAGAAVVCAAHRQDAMRGWPRLALAGR